MKDKNPPTMKNGANGMYFCLFFFAHIAPPMHAIISAIDRPVVPSHSPPTPINFMSPIPIGTVVLSPVFCRWWSYSAPMTVVSMYPNVAPITPSDNLVGNIGKNVINISPINISGNRYASGIILRLKSASEICTVQYAATSNRIIKNM